MVSNFLGIRVVRNFHTWSMFIVWNSHDHKTLVLHFWPLLYPHAHTHTYNPKRWSHAENFRYYFAIGTSRAIELQWFGYSHWDFNGVYGYYVHLISHLSLSLCTHAHTLLIWIQEQGTLLFQKMVKFNLLESIYISTTLENCAYWKCSSVIISSLFAIPFQMEEWDCFCAEFKILCSPISICIYAHFIEVFSIYLQIVRCFGVLKFPKYQIKIYVAWIQTFY